MQKSHEPRLSPQKGRQIRGRQAPPEAATSFSPFPTSQQTMLLAAQASWGPPHALLRRARSLLLVEHALLLDAHALLLDAQALLLDAQASWGAPHVMLRRAHVMLLAARTSWWPPRSLLPRAQPSGARQTRVQREPHSGIAGGRDQLNRNSGANDRAIAQT
jgi:hypothetical protein